MKKIITLALLLAFMIPTISLAYSVSGSRSYSVPSRSYTPSYHSSYTPSYSAPRSYSVSTRSYTAPTPIKTVTPTVSSPTTYAVVPHSVTTQTSPAYQTSYNPFNGNFFLWYWIFGANHYSRNTTTHATTTSN